MTSEAPKWWGADYPGIQSRRDDNPQGLTLSNGLQNWSGASANTSGVPEWWSADFPAHCYFRIFQHKKYALSNFAFHSFLIFIGTQNKNNFLIAMTHF